MTRHGLDWVLTRPGFKGGGEDLRDRVPPADAKVAGRLAPGVALASLEGLLCMHAQHS